MDEKPEDYSQEDDAGCAVFGESVACGVVGVGDGVGGVVVVYSMIDLKSTQLCFRVGQVVSLRRVKISLIKPIFISYLVSLCVVYLPQCLQNLFTSKRVGFGFPLILIE